MIQQGYMMDKNCFYDKNSTHSNLLKAVEKLNNNIDKIKFAISNQNQTYLHKESYQLIAQLLTPSNSWERMLYHELIQTCFQLELKCQHSSFMFLKAFITLAKEYGKKDNIKYNELVEHNQREGSKYLKKILQTCYPASVEDVEYVVDYNTKDEVIASVVKQAVSLAGVEGNVVVEEFNGNNIVVELQFGYNFKVNPFKGFTPQFGTWTRTNAKVLLVDGLIEKVSEMDKVLNKSFETKIPLIIVAQGFSEEVIATLHANNTRGAFDIIPIRIEQSLDALNMLNDIGAVAGCDVVSSLKGEVLTFVDYDCLPTIEKASLTNNVITIQNNKTRNNVLAHLSYLMKRRKDQEENTSISDLSDLTTKRIQNLLVHLVKISVPSKEANKYKAAIDNGIRACRTAYTYGFCKPEEMNLIDLSNEWQSIHKTMTTQENKTPISSIGLYLAGWYASSLAASYFTAAGAIIS